MPRESFSIEGISEFEVALKQLGTEVATGIGRDAVLAAANLLKDAWVAGAPYAERTSTSKSWLRADGSTGTADYGHLRDNIQVRPVRAQKANAVVFKVTTGNAWWGYVLEYGSVKMAPRPWARPIVERLREELIRTEVDVLREGIEASASGRSGTSVLANGRNG